MSDESESAKPTQKIDVFITFLPDDAQAGPRDAHRKLLRLWVECDELGRRYAGLKAKVLIGFMLARPDR
jgi:hypothetical protein